MEIFQRALSHLGTFATDVFRLSVWLLLIMAVLVPLERLFALHPRKVFRKAFSVDLAWYYLNSLLPKILLVVPMALIAWCLHYVVPSAVHSRVAGLSLWTRVAVALVVGEFGFYWGHRWTHQIPFLWRFHSIHHSPAELDWLVNTHAHPLDIVFVRLCGFVPMYALGLAQPTAGQSLDVLPLLVMLVGTLWGFFIHANLRWRFGWLGLVLSTPAFHHWHHTNDEHANKNYASLLPFMDLLFGTWYMPKKEWPAKYGIAEPMPTGLAAQLLKPLEQDEEGDRQMALPDLSR